MESTTTTTHTITKKQIERELCLYQEIKCQAELLRLDISAWDDITNNDRDEAIEAAVFRTPSSLGMPISSGTLSDSTGRLATALPDSHNQSIARAQLRILERCVARVDAWLAAISNRERAILRMLYMDGMRWGEVTFQYNSRPTDGKPRDPRTLKRWKTNAIACIERLEMSRNYHD